MSRCALPAGGATGLLATELCEGCVHVCGCAHSGVHLESAPHFQGSMGRCSQVGRELTLVSCVMYLCSCGMGLGVCCFQPLLTVILSPARRTPWFQCPGLLKESKNFLSPLPLRSTHGDGYKLLNKQHLEKQWLILTISEGSVGSTASELSREGPGLNPTA